MLRAGRADGAVQEDGRTQGCDKHTGEPNQRQGPGCASVPPSHSRAGEVPVSQGHPWGQGASPQAAIPGVLPGLVLSPPLSLELDAFDAGAKAELVRWMFLYEIPGESSQSCFPFTVAGREHSPAQARGARLGLCHHPTGQPWASCSASPCLSFPVCKMGTKILLYLTGWV